jgi:hypothetical protein
LDALTTIPAPDSTIVRLAKFSDGALKIIGRPLHKQLNIFDGTEYSPASASRIATRTSALASTSE